MKKSLSADSGGAAGTHYAMKEVVFNRETVIFMNKKIYSLPRRASGSIIHGPIKIRDFTSRLKNFGGFVLLKAFCDVL